MIRARLRLAIAAAIASISAIGASVLAAPAAEEGMSVILQPAEDALYPGQPFRVRLNFRATGKSGITIDAAGFSREAFTVKDAKGRPPRKTAAGAPPAEPLTIGGFDAAERVVDLSVWYPDLTARTGSWEVGWKHGDLAAGPIRAVITKPYDPKKDRRAVVETDLGTMTWTLMDGYAPQHVKHFVDLARQGFYDGLTIFKATPGLHAVGGDPNGDGTGGWDRLLPAEISEEVRLEMGLVGAMRRETSMTSHCQFFILLGPNDYMLGKQTFFARVTDGLEVVARLFQVPRKGGGLDEESYSFLQPVKIRRIRIRK